MDIVLEHKVSTLAPRTEWSRFRLTGHLSTQIRYCKRIVVEILDGGLLPTARASARVHGYVDHRATGGADMHPQVFRPVANQERIALAARTTTTLDFVGHASSRRLTPSNH